MSAARFISMLMTRFHSGMDELIRAVLTELAKGSDENVVKDIFIVSNGVRHDATGKWSITWRHPDRYDPIFLPFSHLRILFFLVHPMSVL